MLVTGQGAIANTIAVHITITRKAFETLQIGFGQHLAALKRGFWVIKWLAHPVVHANVEVA